MIATGTALPPRAAAAKRQVRRDTPFRQARTCWGHLAGVAGVELMDMLQTRGWVMVADVDGTDRRRVRLTDTGVAGLAALGLPTGRSGEGNTCLDWTERRPHIGGALGRLLVELLVADCVIERQQGARAVSLHRPLAAWLTVTT